jgi:aldose 1-epimerase
MTCRAFGTLPSGETVEAYTLSNGTGARAEILTYGGIVRSLCMPDAEGRLSDVVLGHERLGDYLADPSYLGAIVGRIAGRVRGGRLVIEKEAFALECNDGLNHLHGGRHGFDKRIWSATPIPGGDGSSSLRLSYLSPDGEEGYPGAVGVKVTYALTAANEFVVESEAEADRATPLSLTQHSYFNLAGEGSGPALGHEVQILATEYTPADESMALVDRREPVSGRGADFTRPLRLGDALPRLSRGHGDLYLLRRPGARPPPIPTLAARVIEPRSGRALEVFTDDFCLQFYTGVALGGVIAGKSGRPYGPHAGLCLECQGYPGALGVAGFGDILIQPGRAQRRRTVYAFSTA